MSKFKYTDFEKQLNTALKHQDEELSQIHFTSSRTIDITISETEDLLRSLGIDPSAAKQLPATKHPPSVVVVPSWEELYADAYRHVGSNCPLESIFTEEELRSNEASICQLRNDFNDLHRLDRYDMAISAVASIVGAAVDILLVGIPQKTSDGLKAGPLSDYIRSYFDKKFPEAKMKLLANSKVSKVPYDAQDNRHTTIHVEGLSAYYHRLLQLGHDPLLGFIFGVADILTGRMTTIDKAGNIVCQVMENYADRKESDIFAALAKQIIHFKSDVTTSMGLPVPLMSLFNLLQFGSIGEAEQTIAEIVQGMYYEGYDFIHFCSMSVSAMLVEVIVRLGYAFKRKVEGYPIKDCIPFSLSRDSRPKLATMLFVAHAGVTAVNTGKIAFTKNPMAINYPEWVAFAKYCYLQLKWAVVERPAKRNAYVQGKLDNELSDLLMEFEKAFPGFLAGDTMIFH